MPQLVGIHKRAVVRQNRALPCNFFSVTVVTARSRGKFRKPAWQIMLAARSRVAEKTLAGLAREPVSPEVMMAANQTEKRLPWKPRQQGGVFEQI